MNFQPNDLNDAVDHILKKLTDNDIKYLESFHNDENSFISKLHHFLGQNLRNSWFLWWFEGHTYNSWPVTKPNIVEYFNNLNIYHADDMSSIILTSVYRKFFNLPINLEEQINKYHQYWLSKTGTINPMTNV